MNDNELQDLVLSGVVWELADTPLVLSAATRAATVSAASDDAGNCGTTRSSGVNIGRTQTSIVPPIAPQQVISVDTAKSMAARPADLGALCRMISEFNHPLRAGATNVVLPHIAPDANGLVIITDIPSGDDDESGRILSGAAGELLDKMLMAIGMSRDNVSIVPLVFWRTPGGRTPTKPELDLARPFVSRVLDLLNPRYMLTLGTLAASEIANVQLPRAHGMPVALDNGVTVMPIYHPNYLMLKPAAKRDAWNALQLLQNLLKTADK